MKHSPWYGSSEKARQAQGLPLAIRHPRPVGQIRNLCLYFGPSSASSSYARSLSPDADLVHRYFHLSRVEHYVLQTSYRVSDHLIPLETDPSNPSPLFLHIPGEFSVVESKPNVVNIHSNNRESSSDNPLALHFARDPYSTVLPSWTSSSGETAGRQGGKLRQDRRLRGWIHIRSGSWLSPYLLRGLWAGGQGQQLGTSPGGPSVNVELAGRCGDVRARKHADLVSLQHLSISPAF